MVILGVIMKSLLFGLLLAMSAALPAAAEDWVYISESANNTLHVDADSVTPINGGYAYTEMVTSKEQDRVLVAQSEMFCRERQFRPIAYSFYNKNGQFIRGAKTPDAPFEDIKIETIKSTLWEKLCN